MKRKGIWIKLIFFLFVFSLFSFNFINYNTNLENKKDVLKTSDIEISIITPENKTYTEPMSGYYLASYGFESDPLGLWHPPKPPFDDTILNPINMTIVEDQFGHKKILKLIDSSAIDIIDLAYTVSPSDLDDGTIEFWWATNDTSKYGWHIFDLYRHVYPYSIGYMELNGGRFHMRTNTGFLDHSVIPQNNTWYHIRVDWSRYGGYQGLSVRRYKVTIDGTEGPELVFNQDNDAGMRYIRFSTGSIEKDYEWYIDAIGVSADINYNVGDNLNEGLLLSFENTINFDWIGYSLDGLINKTILGNTTIPMPAESSHNIQVFGMDSLGTIYASNLRHFTLDVPMINIITPENKTYRKPMSGYYPATFGFENDEVGTNPAEWIVYQGAGYVNVKDKMNNHQRVVELYDGINTNHDELHGSFSLQAYGTVEYWILSDEVTMANQFTLMDDHAGGVYQTGIGWLDLDEDKIRYEDNTGWHDTSKIVYDDTWYHIKVEFECSTGNYHGLAQQTWRFFVDGEEFGDFPFKNAIDNVSQVYFFTRGGDLNYRCYIDAVGFSWDPNYNIGDNMDEGLLLSFDTSFTPDWIGYSLDGLTNKTILGDTTIPFLGDGSHSIQVFGNDSMGEDYESAIRYFVINTTPYINITTPENKTYLGPMSGYYPATFGFENDEVGTDPNAWVVYEGAGYVTVKDKMNNHQRVVELYDGINTNHDELHGSFSLQTYGTVEYWIMSDDVTKANQFTLMDDHAGGVYQTGIGWLDLDEDKIRYEDNTGWHDTSKIVYDNRWYHIKVEFECSTGNYHGLAQQTWRFFVNGEEFGDFPFKNAIDNVSQAYFFTRGGDANYRCYIDAVGFSWDPNYNIGDNFIEGLLLSLDTNLTPDWMGYSLDRLTNKTILGDSTFPLPANGAHNIQVFGNDSLGTMHESEIRYFSINTPPPSINIITPSIDEFYSNIAPSFSISITAFYQITTWYTLDSGGTNIIFTGSSGTINQTEWDGRGEGAITIRFYVNDSLGRLNYDEITINKDITDPVITINSPLFGEEFTTMPPSFNISVDELNIDAMWYTIDGGLTTYNISEYSGFIDSIAWNFAPNGAITIRFYVRDKAGNEDYEEVIIQKSSPPYISPDNSLIIIIGVAVGALSILIGFSLILYIILRRKRKYEPSKFKELKKPEIRVKTISGSFMCPYCHNENDIKHRYCIYCGSSLVDFKPNNI